jgi:hypothetical protein
MLGFDHVRKRHATSRSANRALATAALIAGFNTGIGSIGSAEAR